MTLAFGLEAVAIFVLIQRPRQSPDFVRSRVHASSVGFSA
jgi:hypothetical protein